jgi:hypothetical protein
MLVKHLWKIQSLVSPYIFLLSPNGAMPLSASTSLKMPVKLTPFLAPFWIQRED